MAKKSKDSTVGYKKPPKDNQFTKGKSGNPKGRPKGTKNLMTTFHQITQEPVLVTENGKSRTVTKLHAIVLQVTNKAMTGDLRAAKEVLQWHRIMEELAGNERLQDPDGEKDQAIMRRVIARIKAAEHDMSSTTEETTKNLKCGDEEGGDDDDDQA